MNEFNQFVKHKLKAEHYIRYADDFVFLSHDRKQLTRLLMPERSDGGQVNQLTTISGFLKTRLHLDLHPNKIILKTFASGVDFLGWVNFPTHRILRTATKKRMFRRIKVHAVPETLQSYLGLINHGNSHKLEEILLNNYWNYSIPPDMVDINTKNKV